LTPRLADIDSVDKAIIEALAVDGRTAYAKLAPLVGLSEAAVRQRVTRLRKAGVIQIVAVADPSSVGFTVQGLVGIRVTGDVRAVAKALKDFPAIDHILITAGRFDILAEVICKDATDLFELVNDRVRAIDGVLSAEVFPYLDVVKESYYWRLT
jgi:Lrp/AsnC family transcriptional regulator for asnA, asnC and gidA